MTDLLNFYIDGAWVAPDKLVTEDVIDPRNEQVVGRIAMGNDSDVNRAVAAAKAAFAGYAEMSVQDRLDLLQAIISAYQRRSDELVDAVQHEMGAPASWAKNAHVPAGLRHLTEALKVLQDYPFDRMLGTALIAREPIGVCGLITPWNWPLNQLTCKVGPALAVGCTMVLKPSERSPLSAMIFADILHEAGVPKGVFNLVNGDGPTVGAALASHPDIDMVSFTGSTRAGVAVAKAAADTVKRVSQELGGKSANILLHDADLENAVRQGVLGCMRNTGQSCNAPTRMLVPRVLQEQAIEIAVSVAQELGYDDSNPATVIGPVANAAQFARVQHLIEQAIAEGSRVVIGGPGRPAGIDAGYFVQPTIFADVDPSMTIAREEVFGPVLAIIPYDTEDQAVAIANDSVYGLSGYVSSANVDRARSVARRLRTGMVHINGSKSSASAPFGGYKQSGNGREWGVFGFDEYLETKAIFGY
ncbi:aldehyde dehydrogenase family protein [Pigmentiphaga aceris]|uniref:Aldehyde dehydrogenase family protein n=1 Tax=Pigmentiphaga aceris TaxID=1940612 RepID=A0A5C0AWN0_9BURK|nr:aldehyde dehydrogenase family protein [Pigmentiphaga aceris]QEI06585.1 aldehyde dehydrogenase family protein [Pigmentiphaga aceris]